MKRNLLILLLLLVFSGSLLAQKPSGESIRKRFSLGFTLNQDFWMNVPDSIKPNAVNLGVDVYTYYNFPMDRKGKMSFFAGAGIGAHNFYHNALIKTNSNGISELHPIEAKLSKLSITYLDVPFGFRYKSASKVHATLGFKVGWKMNDHSKYKGNDYLTSGSGTIKVKFNSLDNIYNMHYGPYFTIGYKWYGISAFYQIPAIFEKDKGPDIYPISVGLSFRPF